MVKPRPLEVVVVLLGLLVLGLAIASPETLDPAGSQRAAARSSSIFSCKTAKDVETSRGSRRSIPSP